MGPWEAVVVVVSTVAGVFFAVMGCRGLVEVVQSFSGRCADCGRASMLPLPMQSHRCRRCQRGHASATEWLGHRLHVRH
jgi:hypothetical protein